MNIRRMTPVESGSTPSGILRWEDPPPKPPNRQWALEEGFRQLRSRPGRWALIHIYPTVKKATSAAGNARTSVRRRRLGRFQVTTRTLKDGRCGLYARFVDKEV